MTASPPPRFPHRRRDALKIDRAFVSNMGQRPECAEIVRTIKALATNLGIPVVAEGVETAEQLAQVRTLQCEYAQGYYFSRPLEGPAMAALIGKCPELC